MHAVRDVSVYRHDMETQVSRQSVHGIKQQHASARTLALAVADSLDELYAIHRLPTGIFSGSVIYIRFPLMDPSPDDMLTTTLDCFLRSKGRKFIVTVKGPNTLIFRISSYLLTGLHTVRMLL